MIENLGEHAAQLFTDAWEQRNWRSVPGPGHVGHYHEAAQGHRDFTAHIDGGLDTYLRGHLFWLEQRRESRDGEALPRLQATQVGPEPGARPAQGRGALPTRGGAPSPWVAQRQLSA